MRTAALLLLAALCAAPAAAQANPKAEDALRESVLRLAAGDVAGAEASARAAVAAAPADPRALQQLARAANASLDFPSAEDAATRALDAAGPTPALLCLRSEARSGRGDYQGALEDAQKAARINPGSGQAALRSAVAKEGLMRPPEETLADYARAAELDAALVPLRDAAVSRLTPPVHRRGGLGAVVALLAVSALVGWAWGRGRGDAGAPASRPAPPPVPLSGAGRLKPKEAARMLAKAADDALDPDATRELAERLYERLTGRPPYTAEEAPVARRLARFPAASSVAAGLPVGIDAFFARALDADPARRFRTGAELAGAFRSLVDPAID
ncbi:MAG: hypothetical protein HY079_00980 [Elusimicrobia bacterium]|nr:hypothetical protein [Elusimicrobiota bacterium]